MKNILFPGGTGVAH